MDDWHKLTFDVPISESVSEDDVFKINGTAIHAMTTRNGTIFLAEELEPSAKTLRNKPILKDHNNSVDSIVGKTTNNVNYDKNSKSIVFEGIIKNKEMIDKINEGLINSVSVGATYQDIEYNDDNTYVLKGIDFLELSLVAVPADKNATFTQAVTESFNLKKKVTEEIQDNVKKEEKPKMAEESVEIQELKASNEAMLKELETFRAEKAAREAQELAKLQAEYKELVDSLGIEGRDVSNVSNEAISILVEDLKKIQEQAEEAEAEEEPEEAEAEEESEEAEEAEEEVQEEKMNGKINKESESVDETLGDFVVTTEGVSVGYGLYKEEFDNPRMKR